VRQAAYRVKEHPSRICNPATLAAVKGIGPALSKVRLLTVANGKSEFLRLQWCCFWRQCRAGFLFFLARARPRGGTATLPADLLDFKLHRHFDQASAA